MAGSSTGAPAAEIRRWWARVPEAQVAAGPRGALWSVAEAAPTGPSSDQDPRRRRWSTRVAGSRLASARGVWSTGAGPACSWPQAHRPRPTPSRRPHRLDHAGPPARARPQPLRGSGLRGRRHVDRTSAVVKVDSLAPARPAAVALERPTPTARRLAEASLSPNTRRAYSGALQRLDVWLAGRRLEDATLAAYVAELHDQGRAPSSASTAVAAACFRARLARDPSPRPGTHRPGSRWLPAYRRRPRPRTGAAVRGGGPGRRSRHLPSPAASRPRRRVRPGRPRARPTRRRDRSAPLHGGNAAERGERPVLGRRRRRGGRRRRPRHRPPEQDEPGGRAEGRAVREGQRRLRAAAKGRRAPPRLQQVGLTACPRRPPAAGSAGLALVVDGARASSSKLAGHRPLESQPAHPGAP